METTTVTAPIAEAKRISSPIDEYELLNKFVSAALNLARINALKVNTLAIINEEKRNIHVMINGDSKFDDFCDIINSMGVSNDDKRKIMMAVDITRMERIKAEAYANGINCSTHSFCTIIKN